MDEWVEPACQDVLFSYPLNYLSLCLNWEASERSTLELSLVGVIRKMTYIALIWLPAGLVFFHLHWSAYMVA